jgi:hypothetical protein
MGALTALMQVSVRFTDTVDGAAATRVIAF